MQWALLAMQIGLAVALWAMREEYKDGTRRRRTAGRRFWREGQVVTSASRCDADG